MISIELNFHRGLLLSVLVIFFKISCIATLARVTIQHIIFSVRRSNTDLNQNVRAKLYEALQEYNTYWSAGQAKKSLKGIMGDKLVSLFSI